MLNAPIVFADPAFVQDHTGIVGLIACPDGMSGRIKFALVHIDELLPPCSAEDILAAIVRAEKMVLKHARGATLLVGADISGNGAAMVLPLLNRYASTMLRFVRWQGGDAHGRPGDPEKFGTSPAGPMGARVWSLSKMRAFLEMDEVGAQRLAIHPDLTDEQLAPLRKAAAGTQTKTNASGRIVPATDQTQSDDVLSALAGGIAVGQTMVDWNAVRRAMAPVHGRSGGGSSFSSAAWT